jgi:hypothetical protein
MRFKKGQRVILKSPFLIEAIVEDQIYSDPSVPEDQLTYHVTIPETRKRVTGKNLEPIPEDKTLRPYSPEWNEEVARFVAAGQQMLLHPDDSIARAKLVEAGHKLGWIVPIAAKNDSLSAS